MPPKVEQISSIITARRTTFRRTRHGRLTFVSGNLTDTISITCPRSPNARLCSKSYGCVVKKNGSSHLVAHKGRALLQPEGQPLGSVRLAPPPVVVAAVRGRGGGATCWLVIVPCWRPPVIGLVVPERMLSSFLGRRTCRTRWGWHGIVFWRQPLQRLWAFIPRDWTYLSLRLLAFPHDFDKRRFILIFLSFRCVFRELSAQDQSFWDCHYQLHILQLSHLRR